MKKTILLFISILYTINVVAQLSITPLLGLRNNELRGGAIAGEGIALGEYRRSDQFATFSLDVEIPLKNKLSLVFPFTYMERQYLSQTYFNGVSLRWIDRRMYDSGAIARWRSARNRFIGIGLALEVDDKTRVIGDCDTCNGVGELLTTKVYYGLELQTGLEYRSFIIQGRYRYFVPSKGRDMKNDDGVRWVFESSHVLCLELGYRIPLSLKTRRGKRIKRTKPIKKGKQLRCPSF